MNTSKHLTNLLRLPILLITLIVILSGCATPPPTKSQRLHKELNPIRFDYERVYFTEKEAKHPRNTECLHHKGTYYCK